jgi:tetratricopeptide (TPR) repeat protein
MSEGSDGGGDSRREHDVTITNDPQNSDEHRNRRSNDMSIQSDPEKDGSGGGTADDTYGLYQRGMSLLERGSAAAAAQLLERAAAAEPESRSVLEALARAQFDAGWYTAAAGNFRRIVEASPSDDYAQFGLGLSLARTGDHEAAAEHLALAAAMRPNLSHYTAALRSVRATLSARHRLREDSPD